MFKRILNLNVLALILCTAFALSSCENTLEREMDEIIDTDVFAENIVLRIDEEAATGRRGCFEFVFPITITVGDRVVKEINNYEEFRSVIKRWKESDLGSKYRPEISFPINLLKRSGEIITVESAAELKALKKLCDRWISNSGGNNSEACFRLEYPLTVNFPDGTSYSADSGLELRLSVIRWNIEHRGEYDRKPMVSFPINVSQDGESMTVNSHEELHALKESCQDGI